MAKICNIGILSVIRKTIGGKGYFLMNEENNDFIRVNQNVKPFRNDDIKSYGAAIDLAKRLNVSINTDRIIGKVFYPKQYSDMIGVDINPSDGQLAILNAEEEADMAEGLAMIADEMEQGILEQPLTDDELSNNALIEQDAREELAYIEEENIDNEDFTLKNDVPLNTVEETEEERMLNKMIDNGEIQTYCN